MAILAILWQQELILNSTCRLSAGRRTAFLSGQEIGHITSVLVSVSICPWFHLYPHSFASSLSCVSYFALQSQGSGSDLTKGWNTHHSVVLSLVCFFFAADVSICVPCFPFLMSMSIHTQHIALSLSFPSGGLLLPPAVLRHI